MLCYRTSRLFGMLLIFSATSDVSPIKSAALSVTWSFWSSAVDNVSVTFDCITITHDSRCTFRRLCGVVAVVCFSVWLFSVAGAILNYNWTCGFGGVVCDVGGVFIGRDFLYSLLFNWCRLTIQFLSFRHFQWASRFFSSESPAAPSFCTFSAVSSVPAPLPTCAAASPFVAAAFSVAASSAWLLFIFQMTC